MKFIHIADLHASKNRITQCLEVLDTLKNYIVSNSTCREDAPPLLIAGDFWDSTITNTDNSGFTKFLKAMEELNKVTDIYMVEGTSSHEPAGSLDCFSKMGITVFSNAGFYKKYKSENEIAYRIFGLPEPRKSNYNYNSQKEMIDVITADLRSSLDSFIEEMETEPCPINILMYHGEIKGTVYQNGMKVSDTSYAIPPSWFKELNMDYIACGHIHMDMHIEEAGNCYYSGSCYPTNFGETLDCGFNVVDIEVK